MSKKGFMQFKSNRRSHRAFKIKTDRMRHKDGQKKRSIAAETYNESESKQILKYEKPKRQNKQWLKAEKEKRIWEKANGSEKQKKRKLKRTRR